VRASSRAETSPWAVEDRARAHVGWRARNLNDDRAGGRPSPLPPPPLALADTMLAVPAARFGPYVILDKLGDGGLSVVHRATDTDAAARGRQRTVALKRLHAHHAGDWELVDAFLREAQLGNLLRHPHVARTYAYGKIDHTFYAATELALGPTLGQVVRQCRAAAGAIPTGVVVELLIQLADAVDHLHTRRPAVIHRDIQPDNAVVTAAGVVKLVDFGVAKTAARRQTRRGILKGTAAYFAPEYLDGELDARADLFAIGVIGHELLVGRSLFAGASEAETLRNVRGKVVPPPSRWAPEVPRDLDDIVMTALQRDPARRWQNAAALRFALTTLADAYGGRRRLVRGLVDWLGWAFEREPRRDTQVARLVDAMSREHA
jgi:serine/threonine-protein kinase